MGFNDGSVSMEQDNCYFSYQNESEGNHFVRPGDIS